MGDEIMENSVGLVRVDSRLLHGQVVTRWIKQVDANEVIILDDELASDEFMIEVFEMAAPEGVELIVKPINEEMKNFLEERDLSHSIVLFRNITTLMKASQIYLPFEKIQIGGIGGAQGRTVVYNNITLTKEEFDELKSLEGQGKNIFLQTVPEDKELRLEKIEKKF